MALKDVHALVAGLVAKVFEENAASEERELDCLNVDVGLVPVPCVRPYQVGDAEAKDTIEEEEEEDDNNHHNRQLDEEDPVKRRYQFRSSNVPVQKAGEKRTN